MVSRSLGWRLAAPLALMAAGAVASAQAQEFLAPAAMPGGGQLVWGGAAPPLGPDGLPVYRPSAARADGMVDAVPPPAAPSPPAPQPGGYEAGALAAPEPLQPPPAAPAPPPPSEEDAVRSLYEDLMGQSDLAPAPGQTMLAPAAARLPPPGEESSAFEPAPPSLRDAAALAPADPWAGLQALSPGVVPVPTMVSRPPVRAAAVERGRGRDAPGGGAAGEGLGATVTGYAPLPAHEAQCRRVLRQLGVTFSDQAPIAASRSCGVPHPVRVTAVAGDVAVRPAATLNCRAAARLSQWVSDEVKPAARWKLWTQPTTLINASSYRCSRVAGSRTISEHATGNAIDIAGFRFRNGDTIKVEPKGLFDFSEKSFQNLIRVSACEYFGTVLGPGYNRAHDDHFHLDLKARRRTVCK